MVLVSGACLIRLDEWAQEPNFVSYEGDEAFLGDQTLEARIEMNVGKLEIQEGDAAELYDLEVHYDSNAFEPKVEFERRDEVAHLDFKLQGRNRSVRRIDKTRLSLRLNPQVKLRLTTETGVAESEIDLTGLQLESMQLRAGVGETKLAMLSPNPADCGEIRIANGVGALEATGLGNFNFRRLVFEGGVGGAQLDFSGAWEQTGEVRVQVGVGGMQLRFPRDLGVELEATQSIFSSINTSEFESREGALVSKNFDQAGRKIKVVIQGGIGGVDIDWL